MNVLVIADRRPDINILEVVRNDNIELVVTLGDLNREDLLPLEHIHNIPKIGVYGNHDSGTYMPGLGIWDMHMKIWDFNNLRFGGFQGCVRYKSDPGAIMCTQQEASELLVGMPPVDVFISHCPPRGINDEAELAHQGFDGLRYYLDTHPPKLWLHGHTYPTPENIVKQYQSTRIEYVFGYKIVQV